METQALLMSCPCLLSFLRPRSCGVMLSSLLCATLLLLLLSVSVVIVGDVAVAVVCYRRDRCRCFRFDDLRSLFFAARFCCLCVLGLPVGVLACPADVAACGCCCCRRVECDCCC